MSRKRMVAIDRGRFDKWMKLSGITQRQLCSEYLLMEPESFNRCLRNGKITEESMDIIAQVLGADPRWLSGEASSALPITYKMRTLESMMEKQDQLMEMVFTFMGCGGISYSDLSRSDQIEAQDLLGWSLMEFLVEKGYYTGQQPSSFEAFSNTMAKLRSCSLPGMSNYDQAQDLSKKEKDSKGKKA